MSSKANSIFFQTPTKNGESSPARSGSRINSVSTVRSKQTTPSKSDSSPRKCRIQTEIQTSPCRGRSVIKNRVQLNCRMSPKIAQDRKTTEPSPRKDKKINEVKTDIKNNQFVRTKVYDIAGVVKVHTSRKDIPATPKTESGADMPTVNVKSMRTCFEHKENKVQSRPPPSPSPSRAKSQPVTPRSTVTSVKGILSSKSKYEHSPTFRVPSASGSSTPKTKLRRSASTGTLTKSSEKPKSSNLARSSSQTLTPKNRVKFQDEATPECFSPVLLESKGEHGSGESILGEITNLTVAVRVRPPVQGEKSVITVEGNALKVKTVGSEHCFSYDYCYSVDTSQQDIFYTLVDPLVDTAFQGYNVCLFAYGQTGSGKSYSMMGEGITSSYEVLESAGIIPRFSKQLFKIIEGSKEYSETRVEISYFEIYNEKIHDLLGPMPQNGRGVPLRVREHPELGPYVVDLTVHSVHSLEKLQNWLEVGNSHKAMAATEMNMNSSRSHSIFTVTLTQSQADDRPSLCSKINLVDLAGSERLALTCATGDRLKEGVSINRSLLTLGKVISSLAEKKKRGFIPYRESVLTWLLRESLGGNSRTAMLATVNPSSRFLDETLSTLRYACQARNIVNTVRVNECPKEKRIRELLEEIQRLKEETEFRDHADCLMKLETAKSKIIKLDDDLAKAKVENSENEVLIRALKMEVEEATEHIHDKYEKEINMFQEELEGLKNYKVKYDREIKDMKNDLSIANNRILQYEDQVDKMRQRILDANKINENYKDKVNKLEKELAKLKELNKELKTEVITLDGDLEDSKQKNLNYEKDISEMKLNMLDIQNNMSHDHCDNQILMLQSALDQSEQTRQILKEKYKALEKKVSETIQVSNHNGCEKEISILKETISELKQKAQHEKCDQVIVQLKLAMSEAEKLVSDMESELKHLKEKNSSLKENNTQNQKLITELKDKLSDFEKESIHSECEERINTLKKALAVSKSINVHIQCQNRISELEDEIKIIQSATVADHSKCEERISDLIFVVDKYTDENKTLIENHKREILEYRGKTQMLEDKISKIQQTKSTTKDIMLLETQIKTIREENSQLKKKKVEDEKKITSLEKQVISMTKELLDVKNQLRTSMREKESSDFLCTQMQEQIAQQDRKLALKSSKQLFVDKENWETPSKVIRRSIAQHSKRARDDRSSLVVKAEEIHQALKDAEDICSRLKIPWVFHLEPEVSTHSWFDVNVRVWDQRNMSSVRWPSSVFLEWLRDIKDDILSKSRGHKLFQSAKWLQDKQLEHLPNEIDDNKVRGLSEEVESLQSQIAALENVCQPKDKQDVMNAITSLGRAVTQLSHRLGLSSPLRPAATNSQLR